MSLFTSKIDALRVAYEGSLKLQAGQDTASEYLQLLHELDKVISHAAKRGKLHNPMSFAGLPSELQGLLNGKVLLYDDPLTLETLALLPPPRTFYVDSWDTVETAVKVLAEFMRGVPDDEIPPFVAPWECFRVRAPDGRWGEVESDVFDYEYVVPQCKRIGLTCFRYSGTNRYAILDELIIRWHIRDPKTGDVLSDFSEPNEMNKLAVFDGGTFNVHSRDFENKDRGDWSAWTTLAPVLAAQGFVSLINHRSVKREVIVDPERPVSRPLRRAANYQERLCERIILSRKTSVEHAVADVLAGENLNGFTPRWTRAHPRHLRSGRWTTVRENFKADKSLTPEQRDELRRLTKPKDYDANAVAWHVSKGEV